MENLPLLLGPLVIVFVAFFIIRKVTTIMLKISIFGGLIIFLGILAYMFRDRLPF